MFNKTSFREWRERHFGKGRVMSGISVKPLVVYETERCKICGYRDEDKQCLKGKRHPEKCSVPLRFVATCPKCLISKAGLRKYGEDFIRFRCTNLIKGKWLCDCRFSLSFHTGDSEDEKSRQRWLAGGDDEPHWTDFSIRKF